jgi:hypothetical protein
MAMEPFEGTIQNEVPLFQPNQVLTDVHLNMLRDYLEQQGRHTRNKLIGTGIVCGLSFRWHDTGGDVHVFIDEGCAITSGGYLIVNLAKDLTHFTTFTRLYQYPPFLQVAEAYEGDDTENYSYDPIYELLPSSESEEDGVAELTPDEKEGRVLVLLLEPEGLYLAKCLDDNCDDKGRVEQYTIRPLLVPVELIDDLLGDEAPEGTGIQPGRSYLAQDLILNQLDYISVSNLFQPVVAPGVDPPFNNLQENSGTNEDLQKIFEDAVQRTALGDIGANVQALEDGFPWIFQNISTPGLATTLNTIQDDSTPAINGAKQYVYDFIRDVADAYNELLTAVSDLVSECGCNELQHTHHVMLGVEGSADVLNYFDERKYTEGNFKYRNYFVPSPVMGTQHMLYERVQCLYKRLALIITHYGGGTGGFLRITPSRDYDAPLGERAIPYYYSATEELQKIWNYDLTRRNKFSRIKCAQLLEQNRLLEGDTAKNDFFRIEGHVGMDVKNALFEINKIRNEYNLPFTVEAISIAPDNNDVTICAFQDLEEEYRYYRDRALGFFREVNRVVGAAIAQITKDMEGQSDADKLTAAEDRKAEIRRWAAMIKNLEKLFQLAKCIKDFIYKNYLIEYETLLNESFKAYNKLFFRALPAHFVVNIFYNLFNSLFLKRLYRIFFMYQYRLLAAARQPVTSLQSLTENLTGLEHLAGVRRGETFLLVSDAVGGQVVADFNMQRKVTCDCDCNSSPCDSNNPITVLLPPLLKPIIMVVNLAYQGADTIQKQQAFFDPTTGEYVIRLDAAGFYAGDLAEAEVPVEPIPIRTGVSGNLKAAWGVNGLELRFAQTNEILESGSLEFRYWIVPAGTAVEEERFGFITIYVNVKGRANPEVGTADTTTKVGSTGPKVYPAKTKVKMEFPESKGSTKTLYRTPHKNEISIKFDKTRGNYLQVTKAVAPALEKVDVLVTRGAITRKETFTINVTATEEFKNKPFEGKILDSTGKPVEGVRIRIGENETYTDRDGLYVVPKASSGQILTAEKDGFKIAEVQVNEKLRAAPDLTMNKKSLINLSGLENVVLTKNLLSGIGDVADLEEIKKLFGK